MLLVEGHLSLNWDDVKFPVISSEILFATRTEHARCGVELLRALIKPTELDRIFFIPRIEGLNAWLGVIGVRFANYLKLEALLVCLSALSKQEECSQSLPVSKLMHAAPLPDATLKKWSLFFSKEHGFNSNA